MNVFPAKGNPAQPTAAVLDEAERLQLALDAGAIVGTWVWDVPNDTIFADERFARTFSVPIEQCTNGFSLAQAATSIHPQDQERVQANIVEAIRRGGPYRCEYRVLQSDGIYRWIEANGRVELDSAGNAVRFPGVLLDIG